jgi:hypothetical protein
MSNSRIILHIPDLAAAVQRLGKPRMPRLEKMLSRAVAQPVAGENSLLADCFGLKPEQIAVAPLERFAEADTQDSACWWRADPVHLIADRDRLVMLPRADLAVTMGEFWELAETINENYAAEGFSLETLRPECGYLRVTADWHCRSWNPERIEGQAVTEFMPTGPDSGALNKLMTEIQMLWHVHRVNQVREAAGKPTINSLWLWGGGRLPGRVAQAPARIISSLPVVRGLAKAAERACESWPADLSAQNKEGDWLLALSIKDFNEDTARVEQELMIPLWNALNHGRENDILFYPGGEHGYALTRRAARRFWRRSRPLTESLNESNDNPAD